LGLGVLMTEQEASQQFYAHVWPHRALVLRTARFLTHNAGEAEDLAQETLMRAFRKIDQLDVSGNPKGWLTSILRHVRIDQTRVRANALLENAATLDSLAIPAPVETKEPDPGDLAALLEELSDQRLIEALYAVPEDIRWALLLIDVEQMAYEEAAKVMDVPPGTVKSRIHRGRQMLRDRLLVQTEPAHRSAHKIGRRI
jgi:RNA polymerase sigma-70 factor, ECF subfamily